MKFSIIGKVGEETVRLTYDNGTITSDPWWAAEEAMALQESVKKYRTYLQLGCWKVGADQIDTPHGARVAMTKVLDKVTGFEGEVPEFRYSSLLEAALADPNFKVYL